MQTSDWTELHWHGPHLLSYNRKIAETLWVQFPTLLSEAWLSVPVGRQAGTSGV